MRWRDKPELQGRLPLDQLIDEAEKAASRTRDKSLSTQITFIKGVTYVSSRSLPEALSVLKQALISARATKDTILEFSVLSFLGHQTASKKLEEGLERNPGHREYVVGGSGQKLLYRTADASGLCP